MAKKISIAQYNSMVRQAQAKQKQAVNKYNQQVRQYNARLKQNQQKAIAEYRRLQSKPTVKYQVVYTSTARLNTYYQVLDSKEAYYSHLDYGADFLDMSERENANNLRFNNILEESSPATVSKNVQLTANPVVEQSLSQISADLCGRWKGAIFSLSPNNPDAGRHFCTSTREIFVSILDIYAPDTQIKMAGADYELTDRGVPTRKSKIKYILHQKGLAGSSAVDFVNEDIENILQLFRLFNDGTHGASGHYSYDSLAALKDRVEDGLHYLTRICQY